MRRQPAQLRGEFTFFLVEMGFVFALHGFISARSLSMA